MGTTDELESLQERLAKQYGGFVGDIVLRANDTWISDNVLLDACAHIIRRAADHLAASSPCSPAEEKQIVQRFAELTAVHRWRLRRRAESGESSSERAMPDRSLPPGALAPTDEELVRRMTQDDQEALAPLVQRLGVRMASLARRILGSLATNEDVEEVVSDAFLDAWDKRSLYDPERASVRTWLSWLVVVHALPKRRSILRLQRLRQVAIERLGTGETEDAFGPLDDQLEAQAQLRLALKLLRTSAPADADLLVRRYVRQQTPTDIARDLGITGAYARVRLFRALQRLRRVLADEE